MISRQKILVYGLGITGISSIKALVSLGHTVYAYDEKRPEELEDTFHNLREWEYIFLESTADIPYDRIDLVLKSPGIFPNAPLLVEFSQRGIEVVSDLELAVRIWPEKKMIAITGTNGKTTTSALVGHILAMAGEEVQVVGNIGIGILWEMYRAVENAVFVVECSSFQLEHTRLFRPQVSGIINITPDHLNWHGTMEAYVGAKKKIALSQRKEDATVLNIDDPILRKFSEELSSTVVAVSQEQKLHDGYYSAEDKIFFAREGVSVEFMKTEEIKIPGRHNIQNTLMAVALCKTFGVSDDAIRRGVSSFPGVAHRIELVDEVDGVKYYNDSKGTNVDASVKALEAIDAPILLIAGGYDKKVSFDDLFLAFQKKGKALLLLGETRHRLAREAEHYSLPCVYVAEDLEDCVAKAQELAEPGDAVLLSPASASWDMYANFEERGDHFKRLVGGLKHEKESEVEKE